MKHIAADHRRKVAGEIGKLNIDRERPGEAPVDGDLKRCDRNAGKRIAQELRANAIAGKQPDHSPFYVDCHLPRCAFFCPS